MSYPRLLRRRRAAFTLIEILIVVIILGVLAAIVIPQFTNATTDSRNASVRSTLQTIRGQIELFAAQHNDYPPQMTTGLWSLTLSRSNSAETNVTQGAGSAFGPYFQTVPVNPVNGLTSVTNVAPATSYGWLYTVGPGDAYNIRALDNNGNTLSY